MVAHTPRTHVAVVSVTHVESSGICSTAGSSTCHPVHPAAVHPSTMCPLLLPAANCRCVRVVCSRLEQQLAEVTGVMSDLRTKLYARLGDSINLDVPRSAAASKA